jgi:hypothetical protein
VHDRDPPVYRVACGSPRTRVRDVSDYYDLFLAVDLLPELPEPTLQELRWLLGKGERPPELKSADWDSWGGAWRAFEGGSASHGFPGADVSLLVRAENRPNLDGSEPWALTIRAYIHEDDFGITMDAVAWLLEQATTLGWVGLLRDTGSEKIQHLVRHENGFDIVDIHAARKQLTVPWP